MPYFTCNIAFKVTREAVNRSAASVLPALPLLPSLLSCHPPPSDPPSASVPRESSLWMRRRVIFKRACVCVWARVCFFVTVLYDVALLVLWSLNRNACLDEENKYQVCKEDKKTQSLVTLYLYIWLGYQSLNIYCLYCTFLEYMIQLSLYFKEDHILYLQKSYNGTNSSRKHIAVVRELSDIF